MKTKPYIPVVDTDAEDQILGAMLVSAAAAQTARQLLAPGDFFHELEQGLFTAVLESRDAGMETLVDVRRGAAEMYYGRTETSLFDLIDDDRFFCMVSAGLERFSVKAACRRLKQMAELRTLFPEAPGKLEPYATQHPTVAAHAIRNGAECLGVHILTGERMYAFRRPTVKTMDELVADLMAETAFGRHNCLIEALLRMEPEAKSATPVSDAA